MRHKVVPIKNVARLNDAADSLLNRGASMPGMGLVYGPTGAGKTTAVTWQINQCHGVYVRAIALATPSSLLDAVCRELDFEIGGSCATKVEAIVGRLATSGRPLFVDEADHVADHKKLTETLRDLHDLATVPVILIGMGDIRLKLTQRVQLTGRIAEWVEFGPCDLDDARKMADQLCEIRIDDGLLERLHAKSNGYARHLVVGMARLETHARHRGKDALTSQDVPDKFDFFVGSAAEHAPRLKAVR